jgi:8-oxo-dGTP diphosphatase
MIICTSCYLVRGDAPVEVLIGLKKTGFGMGKYAGIGGKVEAGESIAAAAVRELEEETGLKIGENDLMPSGKITFLFPARPDWNLMMHVFVVRNWAGTPLESREIRPFWFNSEEIPYDGMWADAVHWLPKALAGKQPRMVFTYQNDNETLKTFSGE